MAKVNPETIKRIALEFFDYSMSDATAMTVAAVAGTMQADARQLGALGLEGLEPPFSYATLEAEAERLRRRD